MSTVIDGSDGWRFVDVSTGSIDEALLYLARNPEKTSLFLDAANCERNTLDRIVNNPAASLVRSMHLLNNWGDISPLKEFPSLENLSIGFENSRLDFGSMTKLHSIGGVWSRNWVGLEKCSSLRQFHVSGFTGVMSSIPQLGSLTRISLIRPSMRTIEGVSLARNLESFEVTRANGLLNIDSLSSVKLTLLQLVFDKCKKIRSYSAIVELVRLRKLVLAECAPIQSIGFVSVMPDLEVLSIFESILIDNNLSPCLVHPALREFLCDARRTYRPTVATVKSWLHKRENKF